MSHWVRRLVAVVFWLGLGALGAGILGFILEKQGAVIPFVAGIIAVSVVGPLGLIMIGIRGTAMRRRPEPAPAIDLPRQIARVESLREVGITVGSFQHLYEFTVTVFPRTGRAQRQVFSQFITMGQLPNFYTGRYVVVASAEEPARLLLDPEPDAHWAERVRQAPEAYDDVAAASDAPVLEPVAPTPATGSPGRAALNLVIVLVCVIAGFAGSLIVVLGGPSRTMAFTTEVPQRITGDVHGLWDSAMLDIELADLRTQLSGRELTHLVVWTDYITLAAVSATDPQGEDAYSARDGWVTLSWTSALGDGQERFAIGDLDPDALRRAVGYVYGVDPGAAISSALYRVSDGMLIIDVTVDGTYTSTSYEFEASGVPRAAR